MKKTLRFTLLSMLMMLCGIVFAEDELANGTFNGKDGEYTEGWTTNGTGRGRTDCVIIGADENITSPSLDLSQYTKVTIAIKARRFANLSGSKATIDASINGESVGTTDATTTTATTSLTAIEFTPDASMTAVSIVFTCTNATSAGSTHGAGINSIVITGTKPATVEKPVFTPNGGKFVGSQEVTLSCATEGATIYYTLDGNDPTVESTEYAAPFTVTETTTVKAIAVKDEDKSEIASAKFTAIPTTPTLAELTALENDATFAFGGEALVVAKPNAKYVFVKDESAAALIYDKNGDKTTAAEVGKTIAKNWTGKVSIYNKLFELVPDENIVVKDGDTVAVTYPVVTVADINADNINKVVTLKGITSWAASGKNITLNIGETEIAGYNQFGLEIAAAEEGKTYEMVGAIGRYNDNIQFQPIEIKEEVLELVAPDFTDRIVNAEFNPEAAPLGWTEVVSGQFRDFGMYQIGGEKNVRFAAPTVDSDHLSTEYAAGFECRWESNYAAYSQNVTLPAGEYTLLFDVENVNGNTTSVNYENRFFVKVGETTVYDESTEWMKAKSSWTTHSIKFALTEEGTVTISLGYGTGSNNIGADNTPALYVSHMVLTDQITTEKIALKELIDAATALLDEAEYGKEALQTAINTAKTALFNATTVAEIEEAAESLKNAIELFTNTKAIGGSTYLNPSSDLLVNGNFNTANQGWTLSNMKYQANQERPTRYVEQWQGTALTGSGYATQTIK